MDKKDSSGGRRDVAIASIAASTGDVGNVTPLAADLRVSIGVLLPAFGEIMFIISERSSEFRPTVLLRWISDHIEHC